MTVRHSNPLGAQKLFMDLRHVPLKRRIPSTSHSQENGRVLVWAYPQVSWESDSQRPTIHRPHQSLLAISLQVFRHHLIKPFHTHTLKPKGQRGRSLNIRRETTTKAGSSKAFMHCLLSTTESGHATRRLGLVGDILKARSLRSSHQPFTYPYLTGHI